MNLTEFGFLVESVSENTVQIVGGSVNFAMKCYNLFLLYFYFQIMKFCLEFIPRCIRRMSKFTRGN